MRAYAQVTKACEGAQCDTEPEGDEKEPPNNEMQLTRHARMEPRS